MASLIVLELFVNITRLLPVRIFAILPYMYLINFA